WYRGLSLIQRKAVKTLHQSLADDVLEGTAYRVHSVLRGMGVHPVPPKSGLIKLIRMSRANEVAFLWFVMETYYVSENHDNIYGSNEQIIMSAIFWLDLYPTLHALDRVLPLPHASEETRRKEAEAAAKRDKLAQLKVKEELRAKNKPVPSTYMSAPYFAKPVKIKFRRPNLLSFEPKMDARLPRVPPDANKTLKSRWFGAFNFDDSKLITDPVLRQEINSILSSLHAVKLNSHDVESMCEHHKQIQQMEHSLRLNLERIKQEKLQQFFNIGYRTRQRKRQRIVEQLNKLTEYYLAQFHDMAVKTRRLSTCKQLCAKAPDLDFVFAERMCDESKEEICRILKGIDPLPPTCLDNSPPEVKCEHKCMRVPANPCAANKRPSAFHDMAVKTRRFSTCKQLCAKAPDLDFVFAERMCDESKEEICRILKGIDPLPPTCLDNSPPEVKFEHKCKKGAGNPCAANKRPVKQILQKDCTEIEETKINNKDLLPPLSQCSIGREREKYFTVSGENYGFNYQKLFAPPTKPSNWDTQQKWLKTQFIKALVEDVDDDQQKSVIEGNQSGSMTALVDRMAKQMFQEGTKFFEEEYARVVAENTKLSDGRLNFGQKYYDAYNVDQMKALLKAGMQRVAKDPRLVIPALPHVECVPLLVEWICARYGKQYSAADRRRNYKKSNVLMTHLNHILRRDTVRRECRRPTVLVDKLSSIREQLKMSRLLKKYWARIITYFVVSMMELGRLYQTSMLSERGVSAITTYYAYMPAHIQDVHISRFMPL
ncbi:hypothetical protein KR044_013217, partial [Drosophila immigrans]